ncbi:MAG: phosphorylase, partial [Bdellovibrionota bacterium]
MLSHDLFEGNYVRCGYLSDVEFFEDFPSHSEVSASRSHRWIRGDWQLLPWIFGSQGNSLPLISRWKMFDNLRRSLVTPAIFLLLIVSLVSHETFPLPWVILSCLSLMIGTLLSLAIDLIPRRRNTSQIAHLRSTFQELGIGLERFLLFFSLIPHHAWLNVDAITRSIVRVFITRRHLLEWTTAAQATAAASIQLTSFIRGMSVSLVSVALTLTVCLVFSPTHALVTLPMFLLWLASPVVAWKVSSPPVKKLIAPLMPDEILFLHLTARRIWRFFATFVTAEDHYLPPDNFQETPQPVVAHRSSPTNFGLYLLSTLAARDFGWIGTIETIERLENTLKSLMVLPRFEGHFYNWYETTGPRVLEPKYISSVD